MFRLLLILIVCLVSVSTSKQIIVTPNGSINTLTEAAQTAQPGDTIYFRAGTFVGGDYIANLKGTSDSYIHIMAYPGEIVIISGGANGWQLTDPAFLFIGNIIFEKQTGNGLNIDDGGDYSTPAHHLAFSECTFRDINATGNNDLLKLSGVDNLTMMKCVFLNGAAGGSMIDMVGCHDILIFESKFENAGSNAIQNKGRTKNVIIHRNLFLDAGLRGINIGGSTGLQYFRPINANYEASDIFVYSNVFRGCQAAVAFVGAVNSVVINNTIINPTRWIFRILQENNSAGFLKCSGNTFSNNLMIFNNQAINEGCVNIGGNTEPATFILENNLWFNEENVNWSSLNNNLTHINPLTKKNPLLLDYPNSKFTPTTGSHAIGAGKTYLQPGRDFYDNDFNSPRSIGAVEGNPASNVDLETQQKDSDFLIYPNPFDNDINIFSNNSLIPSKIILYNNLGMIIKEIENPADNQIMNLSISQDLSSGIYSLLIYTVDKVYFYKVNKISH